MKIRRIFKIETATAHKLRVVRRRRMKKTMSLTTVKRVTATPTERMKARSVGLHPASTVKQSRSRVDVQRCVAKGQQQQLRGDQRCSRC